MLRRCVDRIFVDHERKIISCFVRKVPIVNREILDLYTEGLKNKPATLRSPVVIDVVAGEDAFINDILFDLYTMPF